MLSDLRFVMGAIMATVILAIAAFGIGISMRLAGEARLGSVQASRHLAPYAERSEWNQGYEATTARDGEVRPTAQTEAVPPLQLPAPDTEEPAAPGPALVPVISPVPMPKSTIALEPAPEPHAEVLAESAGASAAVASADNEAVVLPGPPLDITPVLPAGPQGQGVTGEDAGPRTSHVVENVAASNSVSAAAGSLPIEPSGVEPEIEATGSAGAAGVSAAPISGPTQALRALADSAEQAPPDGNRLAAISVDPSDQLAPPDSADTLTEGDMQLPTASTPRKVRRAVPGIRAVAKANDPPKQKAMPQIKTAKPKDASRVKVTGVRRTRTRGLAAGMVYERPSGSTGYAIAVPASTIRARARTHRVRSASFLH